jgi:hypothetical protein
MQIPFYIFMENLINFKNLIYLQFHIQKLHPQQMCTSFIISLSLIESKKVNFINPGNKFNSSIITVTFLYKHHPINFIKGVMLVVNSTNSASFQIFYNVAKS